MQKRKKDKAEMKEPENFLKFLARVPGRVTINKENKNREGTDPVNKSFLKAFSSALL